VYSRLEGGPHQTQRNHLPFGRTSAIVVLAGRLESLAIPCRGGQGGGQVRATRKSAARVLGGLADLSGASAAARELSRAQVFRRCDPPIEEVNPEFWISPASTNEQH